MAKDTAGASESPGKKSKLPLIAAVLVAMLAGGGGGVFLGGNLLAEKPAPRSSAHAAEAEEEAPAEARVEGPAPAAYTIDNLVLNPAGTEGTRFLMVTLALAPKDEATLTVMKERDPILRDAALRFLERKTVAELTDVMSRDSLKVQIQQVLANELPKNALRKVYLPQFVIQ